LDEAPSVAVKHLFDLEPLSGSVQS